MIKNHLKVFVYISLVMKAIDTFSKISTISTVRAMNKMLDTVQRGYLDHNYKHFMEDWVGKNPLPAFQ